MNFWTFTCVNWLRTLPYVRAWAEKYTDRGLVVVAVHTPELSEERAPSAVRKAVERIGIRDPVMLDQDSSYWRALHAQYWPTFCLIGRDTMLYACVPGEMHAGDERASKVEQALDLLLKAPAS